MYDRFVLDIIDNTVLVMTKLPEKRDEWAEAINRFIISAREDNDIDLTNLLEAIALTISGKPSGLIQPQFGNNKYKAYWEQMVKEINSSEKLPDSRIMGVLHDLVLAPSVDELISVLRSKGRDLFDFRQEDVDAAVQYLAEPFRDQGDHKVVELIVARQIVIIRCRRLGVEATINSLTEVTKREWMSSELKERIAEIIQPTASLPLSTVVEQCDDALRLFERNDDPDLWAIVQTICGRNFLFNQSGNRAENIENSISKFQHALKIHERDSFPGEWVRLMNDLSIAYGQRIQEDRADNIERAIYFSKQALEVASKQDYREEYARLHGNLAIFYTNRIKGTKAANFSDAMEHSYQALDIMTKDNFPEEWAGIHKNLGIIYFTRDHGNHKTLKSIDFEAAIRNYETALEVEEKDTVQAHWASTCLDLSTVYSVRIKGDPDDNLDVAISYAQKALQVFSKESFPEAWAKTQINLANYFWNRKRGDRDNNLQYAKQCFELALQVYTERDFPFEYLKTMRTRAEFYFEIEDWQESYATYCKVFEAGDRLLASAHTEFGRFAQAGETSRSYSQAAFCLVKLDRLEQAFVLMEQGKARIMMEALILTNLDLSPLPVDEQMRITKLKREIGKLNRELHRVSDDHAELYQLKSDQLLRCRTELLTLIMKVANESPGSVPTKFGVHDLQELIPEYGAIVAPIITQKGSITFIIPQGTAKLSHENIIEIRTFTDTTIGELIFGNEEGGPSWWRSYASIRRAESGSEQKEAIAHWKDFIIEATQKLWDSFVGEIASRLETLKIRKVIFLAQGGLQLLPIHAAWRNVEENRKNIPKYFIDEYEISYAPSIFSFKYFAQSSLDRKSQKALVVGISEHPLLPRLEHVGAEAQSIAEILKTKPLLNSESKFVSFQQNLSGCGFLHLACHGFYNWQGDVLDSGVFLYDEPLTLSTVISSEIDLSSLRLVTLSACETGITDVTRFPDEYIGLPAGFIQAGVPGVVASLWMVDDESTRLLMEKFYKNHIQEKQILPRALHEAQLWLKDNHPEYAHPFYWGPFYYTGS